MEVGLSCEYQVYGSSFRYGFGTNVKKDLESDWHQIRIVMAEMIHFIRQMQAYCQLEVIECSWKILIDFLNKKEGDLDAMIDAHSSYLDRMVKKVLLLSPKVGREVGLECACKLSINADTTQENLLFQVRDLFSTILQFRDATVRETLL